MKHALQAPDVPLHELIERQQRVLELSDDQLAQSTGLALPVLGMIKSGHMMLPVGKIAALARALELPADQMLLQYLNRHAPEYLQAVEDCGLWGQAAAPACLAVSQDVDGKRGPPLPGDQK